MNQNESDFIKTDDEKRINDLTLISDELKRQFDLMMRFDDSHNTKAGIILGFIMLIIIQIITTEYIRTVMANLIAFSFFIIGFTFILLSFCSGMYGVRPKVYNFGPEVPKLARQWINKKEKDYTKNIFGKIWEAHKEDKKIIEKKARYVKCTLNLFTFGLVFIILSKIAIMVT